MSNLNNDIIRNIQNDIRLWTGQFSWLRIYDVLPTERKIRCRNCRNKEYSLEIEVKSLERHLKDYHMSNYINMRAAAEREVVGFTRLNQSYEPYKKEMEELILQIKSLQLFESKNGSTYIHCKQEHCPSERVFIVFTEFLDIYKHFIKCSAVNPSKY